MGVDHPSPGAGEGAGEGEGAIVIASGAKQSSRFRSDVGARQAAPLLFDPQLQSLALEGFDLIADLRGALEIQLLGRHKKGDRHRSEAEPVPALGAEADAARLRRVRSHKAADRLKQ